MSDESDKPIGEEAENVVIFEGAGDMPVPVDRVLRAALKRHDSGELPLESVIIIGYDPLEEMFFAASSNYNPDILWALEQAKAMVMQDVAYEDDEDEEWDGCDY